LVVLVLIRQQLHLVSTDEFIQKDAGNLDRDCRRVTYWTQNKRQCSPW